MTGNGAAIPLVDLKAQYGRLREEIRRAIEEVIQSASFAGGPAVERFEEHWARFCGSRYAVGVGSGTEALWLALLALGIGRGDEVITSPLTFVATVEAIVWAGATPVFVDVIPSRGTIDPDQLEGAITRRTRAIVPVHLYGHPADMDAILAVARRHGLAVVEDACQAHGASYRGRPAGSLGDVGCFSFYPGKNLGAYGDAGAVVTGDEQIARRIRALRDHGQLRKHEHIQPGWNARMDAIQAAVLDVKLRHLPTWNKLRRAHARRYDRLLSDVPAILLPSEAPWAASAWHLYVIRTHSRGPLLRCLAQQGIGCGIHYPRPVHRQPAFDYLGYPEGSFPAAEKMAAEVISLPLYPELTSRQIERVAGAVRTAVEATRLSPAGCAGHR